MENNEIDYKRAAEQFRNGEPLFGKDGALAPMLERILNAALEGEMDAHFSSDGLFINLNIFSNYILFELYLQGILFPSLFGEGLGERLLFLLLKPETAGFWICIALEIPPEIKNGFFEISQSEGLHEWTNWCQVFLCIVLCIIA